MTPITMTPIIKTRTTRRRPAGLRSAVLALATATSLFAAPLLSNAAALAEEPGRRLPEAALRSTEAPGRPQTAIVAGGCFWGVQGVFQHVRGVKQAVSGYAGGTRETATYAKIGTGRTGHAEAVRITYDPSQIRYDELLRIFFSVALDPTEVNRQGPDEGPQYRSAIFPADAEQARVAKAYIAQLDAAKTYARPIATRIEPGAAFYLAEGYHQDYMVQNPRDRYIVVNDAPKLRDLQRFFPERSSETPVLVGRPPA